MSGQIFISYRREDSSAWAGRLYDCISARLPQSQIFMDVDMAPGTDFVEEIEKNIGACDVLIAVIGKRWLSSADEEGKRRLDYPEDFVRLEIATALKWGIRVMPVLVDGATIPLSIDLPDDLKPLVRRHALKVSEPRFSADSEPLISAVEQVLENARVEQQHKREEQEHIAAQWLAEAKHHLDTKDYAKAQPLFQKAAGVGNAAAMAELGKMFLNVANFAQARHWFQKAAEADDTDAMVMAELGQLYEKDLGGAQDHAQARQWYRKAAEASEGRDAWTNEWVKKALSRLASMTGNVILFCCALFAEVFSR